MKNLYAPTESYIKGEKTSLAADVAAGTNVVITLADNTGLALNDYIVVGREGSETAELVQINSAVTPGTSVQVNALTFAHRQDAPVTLYRYNQRKFYGSTTSGGTYFELTSDGSPVNISPDDTQGAFLECTNPAYAYFKSTYYNSTTAEETSLADATEVLADESQRYCSIHAIRKQVGMEENVYISDGYLETYRKRAESEIDSYLNAKYILPLTNSSGVQEIPFLIENCATLLAGGYIDYQEYGKDGQGVKWLGEARAILKSIQGPGGMQLMGSDKKEMQTQTSTQNMQSYPQSVDNRNGPFRLFGLGQRF